MKHTIFFGLIKVIIYRDYKVLKIILPEGYDQVSPRVLQYHPFLGRIYSNFSVQEKKKKGNTLLPTEP